MEIYFFVFMIMSIIFISVSLIKSLVKLILYLKFSIEQSKKAKNSEYLLEIAFQDSTKKIFCLSKGEANDFLLFYMKKQQYKATSMLVSEYIFNPSNFNYVSIYDLKLKMPVDIEKFLNNTGS